MTNNSGSECLLPAYDALCPAATPLILPQSVTSLIDPLVCCECVDVNPVRPCLEFLSAYEGLA
jgi:hypothetical protein